MTLASRLRAPGWYRAALSQPLGFAVAFGLVVGVRAAYGYDPLIDWHEVPLPLAERYLGDRRDSADVYAHHSLREAASEGRAKLGVRGGASHAPEV